MSVEESDFCLRLRDFFSLHFQNFEALVIKAESRHLQPRRGGFYFLFFYSVDVCFPTQTPQSGTERKAFGAKAHPPFLLCNLHRISTPCFFSFLSRPGVSGGPISFRLIPPPLLLHLAKAKLNLRLVCVSRQVSAFVVQLLPAFAPAAARRAEKTSTVGDAQASEERLLDLFNAELSSERYWRGPRSQEAGEEGDYLTLHCHHQNDSCTEMGSGESHLTVSFIVIVTVTGQRLQTTTFDEKGEPKRTRTDVLLTSISPHR